MFGRRLKVCGSFIASNTDFRVQGCERWVRRAIKLCNSLSMVSSHQRVIYSASQIMRQSRWDAAASISAELSQPSKEQAKTAVNVVVLSD